MQTKFKRHQEVRILTEPDEKDIEDYQDPPIKIKKGMVGKINILLPNGRYHVQVIDKKNETVAYVAIDEENLEAI